MSNFREKSGEMIFAKLNNGVEMPMVGFGVFQIPETETKQAVLDALSVGYRLIDTAQSYFNEKQVGEALAETNVPRKEIFLTTKVWISNYGYENARNSVLESMAKLGVDYVDLVLLHQSFGDYYGAYRALEDLQKEGKIRAIGVSNFNPNRLADIAAFNDVVPQINQIEINPFHQQDFAKNNADSRNVQVEAWAPFAEGRSGIFANEILTKIAKNHDKSVAQVILRWLFQRGIVSVSKSTKRERMAENFAIFDFALTDEDMKKIAKLDDEKSQFFDFESPETVDRFVGFVRERQEKFADMSDDTKGEK
jgi:diketogulonate reductase-like aldo/keto reductase